MTSERLAPFRYFTSGYIGKPNNMHRFLNLENLDKQLKDIKTEFEKFQEPNESMGAYDIIQKFKGKIYIFLDSLLNLNEELPEKYYLAIIVS